MTGEDVAVFCDELLRNAKTYTENRREKLNKDIMKKLEACQAFLNAAGNGVLIGEGHLENKKTCHKYAKKAELLQNFLKYLIFVLTY